jgi:uncharacterized protein YqgQ
MPYARYGFIVLALRLKRYEIMSREVESLRSGGWYFKNTKMKTLAHLV